MNRISKLLDRCSCIDKLVMDLDTRHNEAEISAIGAVMSGVSVKEMHLTGLKYEADKYGFMLRYLHLNKLPLQTVSSTVPPSSRNFEPIYSFV